MEQLTLAIMKPTEAAVSLIYQVLMTRMKPQYHVRLEYNVFSLFSEIKCFSTLTQSWKHSELIEICDWLSIAVADYILDEEENQLLRNLITHEFAYEDENEIRKIMEYCRQMLDLENDQLGETDHGRKRRTQTIAHEIKQYLKKNTVLNISGYLQFRLKSYMEELREVVEYAVDEFLMDKQYQEFIALLKYFVYIQEAKIPAAHLMHKGGHEFTLLNEQMKPIDTGEQESFTVEVLDKDFNFEDLIVSTLITVAPQQIYIHTREPQVQVIQTIMQIFEGRTELCEYCRQCKPLLGDSIRRSQHYT